MLLCWTINIFGAPEHVFIFVNLLLFCHGHGYWQAYIWNGTLKSNGQKNLYGTILGPTHTCSLPPFAKEDLLIIQFDLRS